MPWPWLADQFFSDRERWILWLPVALGGGIAAYFSLGFEPPVGLGPALVLAAFLGAGALRRHAGIKLAVLFFATVLLGFSAAAWRAHDMAAPVLQRQLGPVGVEGRVIFIQPKEQGRALTLDRLRIDRLDAAETPKKIRVNLRPPKPETGNAQIELRPGDRVRLLAILMPPAEPAMPGAYDFARSAWFQRLGAVGLGLGQPERLPPPADQDLSAIDRYRIWLNGTRQKLTERIYRALPGEDGAVAAALMTGERGGISQALEDDYRDSGLTHLLSISGLHLTLVAGLIFFLVRGGLALWEWAALNWPLKKFAAAVAILGAFAYLQLSGAAVPTQRAFVMAALVLLAVLLDRQALSMRSVCWAAAAILLFAPESLLEAGFMMSFAAVVALIAAYESGQARIALWQADAGLIGRGAMYLGLTAATTLVASAATLPYLIFHFNRFVDFGVVANLIAVPLTSLWVMPWGLAAFLAMPFGAEGLALAPMGWGVAAINWTARTVAAWPGAINQTPVMPDWGLAAATLGGLWLCLWQRPWRWLGVLGLAAGLLSPLCTTPPDILFDPTGRVAVLAPDGRLIFAEKRKARGIAAETWLRRSAQTEVVIHSAGEPANGAADAGLRCDRLGCLYRAKGQVIALPKDPAALGDDCAVADLVLATFRVGRGCGAAVTVIDGPKLRRGGAHAIWLTEDGGTDGIRIQDVASERGLRPWVTKQPVAKQPVARQPAAPRPGD